MNKYYKLWISVIDIYVCKKWGEKMNKISFNYEGRELAVDIIYRKRKNISLKVSPKENIQIIAPHKVSSDMH